MSSLVTKARMGGNVRVQHNDKTDRRSIHAKYKVVNTENILH